MVPLQFEITSPPPLVVEVRLEKPACPGESNGELLAIPAGGSGPYLYRWANSSLSGDYVTGLAKGTYDLEVQDNFGCVSIGSGTVIETAPKIRMPNALSPGKFPDLFEGVSNCTVQFQLVVYNRWGQLVHSGNSGWDGTISGEPAPLGTYSYSITYTYVLEGKTEINSQKGAFLLVR
jgi:gliding motility-associated-like protein